MRPLLFTLGLSACSFSPAQQQPTSGDGPLSIDSSEVVIDTPVTIDAKVFLDAPIDAPFDPAAQCPADAYTIALADAVSTSRYRLIATEVGWPAHQADCADDLVGATHLVVFEEIAEAAQLGALTAVPAAYLVGYVQEPNQATVGAGWHTLIGGDVPANSTIWTTGQPNDDGGVENNEQNFGFVGPGSVLVQDGPDDFPAAAVCECDGKPIPAAIAAML